MKFVTSRIVSPKQVRSLREIIEDAAEKAKVEQNIKTASTDAVIKQASPEEEEETEADADAGSELEAEASEEEEVVDAETEEELEAEASEEEEVVDAETEEELEAEASAEANVKVASMAKTFPKFTFKNLSKKASLTSMDEAFLRKYFSVYYPSEYIVALLAEY
jgi:hypothetical protein